MRSRPSLQLALFALASTFVLLGAGPNGCGPVAPTEPLDPDPPERKCTNATCDLYCPNGNVLDANGCETCACNPPPLCQQDSDCTNGQRCDTSVCRSGCEGAPAGTACPAVCYGECVTGAPTSCDPNLPDTCGAGFACVCGRDGGGSSSDPAPGAPVPPPSECTCQPSEPPPPPPTACDPSAPDACGEGFACACAASAGDAAPCTGDGCFTPPPTTCTCQPIHTPPTCDPNNPVCENGGDCVCAVSTGDRAAPPCDPSAPDCGFVPPTPVCYCTEPPPPPPPSCDPNNPVCENGGECVCETGCVPCPEGQDCPPPPPTACYCTEPVEPPPPPTTCGSDPSAPTCLEGQDCLCSGGGVACDPNDPTCTSTPAPVDTCTCVDREPILCVQDADCPANEVCRFWLDAPCTPDGRCGICGS